MLLKGIVILHFTGLSLRVNSDDLCENVKIIQSTICGCNYKEVS